MGRYRLGSGLALQPRIVSVPACTGNVAVLGHFVLVLLKELLDITRHGNVDGACIVVPTQFDPTV